MSVADMGSTSNPVPLEPAGLLIDSSVLIYTERQQQPFDALLDVYGDHDAFVSVVTMSELRHGVHRARDAAVRARRSAFVQHVLDHIGILPIDEAVAEAHATAWAALEDEGQMIGMNDLWIGATAVANGCAVVTENDKEFARVPGLVVIPFRPGGELSTD
jgi:tRNA(fMet)-specific endonuclease VapC